MELGGGSHGSQRGVAEQLLDADATASGFLAQLVKVVLCEAHGDECGHLASLGHVHSLGVCPNVIRARRAMSLVYGTHAVK
jgi:hypothetical protein